MKEFKDAKDGNSSESTDVKKKKFFIEKHFKSVSLFD